jgi:hypothetical protein
MCESGYELFRREASALQERSFPSSNQKPLLEGNAKASAEKSVNDLKRKSN